MPKFLCFVTVLLLSAGAMAQSSDAGLFPELRKVNAERATSAQESMNEQNARPTSLFGEETPEESARREDAAIRSLLGETRGDTLSETLERNAAQTQPQQFGRAEANFFVFRPSEIQIVVPTISRFQFCTSNLTLSNNTSNVVLKTLGVVFKYNSVQVPYTYSGLNPGGSQTGTVALGGDACQVLLKAPGVDVTKCVATRIEEQNGKKTEVPLSESECRAKVKYLPR